MKWTKKKEKAWKEKYVRSVCKRRERQDRYRGPVVTDEKE